MSTKINQKIVCTDCGERLPDEWISIADKEDCPKCGSRFKTISLGIVEDSVIEIHDTISGKVKDKNYNSQKNPRYEFFEGDDVRKLDGRWMKKSRVIDKNNDKYFEKIVDPETGDVLHHCEEPLSEHFGHGTAKFKNK